MEAWNLFETSFPGTYFSITLVFMIRYDSLWELKNPKPFLHKSFWEDHFDREFSS
jgi:hypothetical protein